MFLTVAVLLLSTQTPDSTAERLFIAARFDEAMVAFASRYATDSIDYGAALGLGTIALFHNRLDEAERWLARASTLRPSEPRPRLLLAEAYSRRDRFSDALPLVRAANRPLRAQMLEGFTGRTPHRLTGPDSTRLPFVVTDPLPLVRGFVNGSDTLFLLLDTGGGELTLDSAVASKVGAVLYGVGTGNFAGGQAPVTDGRVDSLRLGEFTMHDVPIRIINTRQFASVFGGRRVDGVIGTVLLYHFLSTIDYPRGQLILRRRAPGLYLSSPSPEGREGQGVRTSEGREHAPSEARGGQGVRTPEGQGARIELPFWLAGDHFIFTWASVNGRPAVPLFVDTGLAGGGFVCSDSAAASFGIDLTRATSSEGVGGAGRTRVTWFTVDSIRAGGAVGKGIRGAIGQIRFRQSFGFDAGGILSHQFFRPYAVTFDFDSMRIFLTR